MNKTMMASLGRVRSLTIAGALLVASSMLAQAVTIDEIKQRGFMNIATEDDYAPFEFFDGDRPSGFTNDIVAELREYADFEIRQDILPWTGLLSAVNAGTYDAAVTGAIVSVERLRVFDFARPTASAQHFYIKRRGDDRINGVADLDGLTVGVQAGSVLLSRLPELDAMLRETGGRLGRVVEYTSYPEIYQDLVNGRLDYAVNSVVGAQMLVATRGDDFELGEPVSGPGFHAYPVPRGNTGVVEYLTEFLNHLQETGRLAELQAKWFGQEFPDLPADPIRSVEQFQQLTGME